MDDVERVALAFDEACREVQVDYAFIGGMAVITWGQPRFTADIDTLLRLDASKQNALVGALRSRGLDVDPDDLDASREDRGHVSIFDRGSSFHLDVKLATTADEFEQIGNAKEVPIASARLRIAAPEDTIAYKLKFGSPQDLQDARSILWRQAGSLDETRLVAMVERLGVRQELQRLRAEDEDP